MSTFALFVAMLVPAIFVAAALAQTQLPPPAGRSRRPPAQRRQPRNRRTRSRVESRVSIPPGRR